MDRFCNNCKHWTAVTPEPEPEYGACQHPDKPWDTPERQKEFGQWSACMGRDASCDKWQAEQPHAAA